MIKRAAAPVLYLALCLFDRQETPWRDAVADCALRGHFRPRLLL